MFIEWFIYITVDRITLSAVRLRQSVKTVFVKMQMAEKNKLICTPYTVYRTTLTDPFIIILTMLWHRFITSRIVVGCGNGIFLYRRSVIQSVCCKLNSAINKAMTWTLCGKWSLERKRHDAWSYNIHIPNHIFFIFRFLNTNFHIIIWKDVCQSTLHIW